MQINSVYIVFGKFIEFVDDEALIRTYHGFDAIRERKFDKSFLDGIENPEYVLIGVYTRMGMVSINMIDATEYADELIKLYTK